MGYRTIVVGTDGSITAVAAQRTAARLARRLRAELVIVSAYDPPRISRPMGEGLVQRAREAARREKVEATTELGRGEPADLILEVARRRQADLVVVHGDTNTTLAGAILGNKLGKPVAHVEAGIRSFDKTMPEEVNRILTDQVSRLLFAPTETARTNLAAENVRDGVHVVGNSVIDALVQNTEAAEKTSRILKRLRLEPGRYAVLTFHRAENVDSADRMKRVLQAVGAIASRHGLTIVFPIHPRTEKMAKQHGLNALLKAPGLKVIPVRILDAAGKQLGAKREWPNPYGDGTTGQRIAGIVAGFFG